MFDLIIRGGTIIDGSGRPKFGGDVGIMGEKIAALGDLHNEHGRLEIDAKGKYVTPGFVDVGNHSDTYWRIFSDPALESLLYQGITTIIGGNCGSSLAPLASHEVIRSIQKWTDVEKISFNWLSMKDFLTQVQKQGLALNFGTLVGHGTLRRGLIGDQVRDISPAEMKTMKKMLAQAMKEGALGFSTGLVYTHAKLASSREIVELAEVVKKYKGVYATHIRGEGDDLIRAVEEAIRIASEAEVKLQISHLKAMGKKNWKLMKQALELIETAKNDGLEVHFDVYPYTATGSVLYTVLPDWVAEGGRKMMLARLKNEKTREKVIKEMRENGFDYAKISISISALDKTLNRKSVLELALTQGKTVEDVVLDILIASGGRVVAMIDVLGEKNVDDAVVNPFAIISSNGSGYNIEHQATGEMVHPRNFGAFPRVLATYVRGRGVIGWEEAIFKMSGLPAQKFALPSRGILAEGNFADVVVFDPKTIQDLATPENPYQYSQGIDCVLVNGQVAMKNGMLTDQRAGQVLRRKAGMFEF
ncbi:MAG: D-aminoacylase [Candidatus Moraniibacteriota bacterium]